MAKKQSKKPVSPTTATPPKFRKGHQLPSRVSEPLWKILEAAAKKERRKIAPTVVILLEEALRARGYEVPTPEEE